MRPGNGTPPIDAANLPLTAFQDLREVARIVSCGSLLNGNHMSLKWGRTPLASDTSLFMWRSESNRIVPIDPKQSDTRRQQKPEQDVKRKIARKN
jgi:hypothetical protein